MGQGPSSKGANRGKDGRHDPAGNDREYDDSEATWSEENEAADGDDRGCRPDTVDRQCTDPWCLIIFIAALAANACIIRYGIVHGNLANFRALVDLREEYCADNITGDRYVYFCQHHPGELNISHPVCVSSCPNDTNPNHSFACNRNGEFANTSDYSTEPVFGMTCRPMQAELKYQVSDFLLKTRHSFVKCLVTEHIEAVVALFFLTVAASYVYLGFVGRCAHVIVWTGILVMVLVPFAFGLYLMGWLTWVGLLPRPYKIAPNLDANPITGAILLFIGLSVACCGFQMSMSVDKAVGCLQDAILCVMDTPVLKWQPVIDLTLGIASNAMTVAGVALILSCQDLTAAHAGDSPSVHILLLTREQRAYLAVLAFMFYWVQQTNYMVSTFVITFIAQIWYFNGGDEDESNSGIEGETFVPTRALGQAYWAAFRYHLGSMAKGALAVGLTRPLRLLLGVLVGFTEMKANPVGIMISAACGLCSGVYREYLEHINADALIEVALNATPYSTAALKHMEVINTQVDTKRILHGTTRVFQWAGIALVSFIGAVSLYGLRESLGGYEVTNQRQAMLAKFTFLCMGLGISLGVCLPFLMVFDTIADTILYVRTVEKLRYERRQQWWHPFRICFDAAVLEHKQDDAW